MRPAFMIYQFDTDNQHKCDFLLYHIIELRFTLRTRDNSYNDLSINKQTMLKLYRHLPIYLRLRIEISRIERR